MENSSAVADPGHAPDEDALRGACEDLLRSWDEIYLVAEEVSLGRDDQEPDPVRFLLVLAFTSHAHHLTGSACSLLNDDDYASAIPLLRVAYESALTAVWAAESEDAARALQNQFLDGAGKLRASVQKTGWFDDVLDRVPQPGAAVDAAPRANGEAGSFYNLCQALEPHPDWLYTSYRLLSAYAHPSGSVVRMFVPGTADEGVRYAPGQASREAHRQWWYAAAMGLLHAGQAMDRLDSRSPRRELLACVSQLLGWEEPLRLTERARLAVTVARVDREPMPD
ncbi:hypothetical protein [Microbacterium sp.]|uniref:hypothetical protein n=1 Tax=Microbacterium sp. TaxID=51671 RepID=UPI0027360616|nr:hypothetical protein [Microbacterium sp.]MDP3950544.1 hypothetical protein [Microbacterium sp.]